MFSMMSERGLLPGELVGGPVPRRLLGEVTVVDSSALVVATSDATAVSCAFNVENRLDIRSVLSRR